MEGALLRGWATEGVDCGGQRHQHVVEVAGGDHRGGLLPHPLGEGLRDLLSEGREFVAVEVMHVLLRVPDSIVLDGVPTLGLYEEVVPLGEGVAVRDMVLGVVTGSAVNSDVA